MSITIWADTNEELVELARAIANGAKKQTAQQPEQAKKGQPRRKEVQK